MHSIQSTATTLREGRSLFLLSAGPSVTYLIFKPFPVGEAGQGTKRGELAGGSVKAWVPQMKLRP